MIAERVSTVAPFLAMQVFEKAMELQRTGRSIVHMEIGEPDFETPQCAKNAAEEAIRAGITHYTSSQGFPDLREAIATHYARTYGVAVDPDQIICTSGSSPALWLLFSGLMNQGDEVVMSNPGYPSYPTLVRFTGGTPVQVPTLEEDGFRLDPDRVKASITPRTKALIINSPCNPTGIILEPGRMKALADLGVTIISDEIYHGLRYSEERDHSILEYTDNAIVVSGFSKAQAMTGWRLGFLILPKPLVAPLVRMAQHFLVSACSVSQRAGLAAIAAYDDVEAMRQEYNRRRKATISGVREAGLGLKVEPQGAFYILANARRFCTDSVRFSLELLENAGLGVTPGLDFGSQAEGFIRFSYATSMENINEGMRRLKNYLASRGA